MHLKSIFWFPAFISAFTPEDTCPESEADIDHLLVRKCHGDKTNSKINF